MSSLCKFYSFLPSQLIRSITVNPNHINSRTSRCNTPYPLLSFYCDKIGSFPVAPSLTEPGLVREIKDPCCFRLAASNMEARSGNELDRRWLFWNDVVPRLFTFPPTSSGLMSLRIPNCLRNHFFVRGLRGGFKLPSLSMSFTDGTFELFFCFSAISSLFKSSDCKSNFGGLFFFALIFILKGKARDYFYCTCSFFKPLSKSWTKAFTWCNGVVFI